MGNENFEYRETHWNTACGYSSQGKTMNNFFSSVTSAISDNKNGKPRIGEETRAKNISIKIWQRIA
ncbi:MAG: hypothetical protein IIW71_00110 [Treponema sp.]|nr:hypothetical protein [Treponema sp.]